jgi:hydroxymethylbilane synthase
MAAGVIMSLSKIRIGTRSSKLALWQAEFVAEKLRRRGVEIELVKIETTGDLDRTKDFGSLGAKGIFVKEIEQALLEHRADIAVHSLKDLPTELPEGLALASVLEREVALDGLVSADGRRLQDLPRGAKLATGSLRRAAQALAIRPDLKIVPLRGNVPTRVQKIREGYADATVLAVAGVHRLGMREELAQVFSVLEMTPAMGQGAVAIESRAGEYGELMEWLEHKPTRLCADAERVFVRTIGGGCRTPVGVITEYESEGMWRITAMISSPDGRSMLRYTRDHTPTAKLNENAESLAHEMYEQANEPIRATLDRSS